MKEYCKQWKCLVWFYDISTLEVYLMPRSSLYIYPEFLWFLSKGFLGNILDKLSLFVYTQLNGFKDSIKHE